MKTSERCTAVEDGKRCPNSNKEKGSAKGLCTMHYQRQRRTGSAQRKQADLGGPSAQVRFLLPTEQHARIVNIAETEGKPVADVLRAAVEHYLERSA